MTKPVALLEPALRTRHGTVARADPAAPALATLLRRVDASALEALATTTGLTPAQVERVLGGYAALLDQSEPPAGAVPSRPLKVSPAARRAANGALVDAVLRDHDTDLRAALAQGADFDHQVDLATLPLALFRDGQRKACEVPVVTLAAALGKARALDVLAAGAIFDRSTIDGLGLLRAAGPTPTYAPPTTLSAHPLVCAVAFGHPACIDVVVKALIAREVRGDGDEHAGAALLDLRMRAGDAESVLARAAFHADLDVTKALLRLPGARPAIEAQTEGNVRAYLTARAALLLDDATWARVAPRHTPDAAECNTMLHAIANAPSVAAPERLARLRSHWPALAAAFGTHLAGAYHGPADHMLKLANAFLAAGTVEDPAAWSQRNLQTCVDRGLVAGAGHFAAAMRAAGYAVALPSEIAIASYCAGVVHAPAGLARALAFHAAGGTPGPAIHAALHKRQVELLAHGNPGDFNTVGNGLTALGYPERTWSASEAREVVEASDDRGSGRALRAALGQLDKWAAIDASVVDAVETKVAALPALAGDAPMAQCVAALRAKYPKARG